MRRRVRRYWAEFVQTGDPNLDGVPHWPAYNSEPSDYFELGEHVGPHPLAARDCWLESTRSFHQRNSS